MRKSFRGILALAMVLALALSAAACGSEGKNSSAQAARVNDTVITEGQLDNFSNLVFYTAGYDPSEMTAEERQNCLKTMVECEVIRQYYEEQGQDIYNDDYDAGKNSFLSSIQSASADYLKENNITEDDLIYYYRASYLNRRLYGDVQAEHDPAAIEEEARKYYTDHINDFAAGGGESGAGSGASGPVSGDSADAEPQYTPYEDVQESIKYTIYSQYLAEKIQTLREGMDIEE